VPCRALQPGLRILIVQVLTLPLCS